MAKSKEQEAYEANPKICPTCGNPIPYEIGVTLPAVLLAKSCLLRKHLRRKRKASKTGKSTCAIIVRLG